MNIFIREMKSQKISLILWCFGMFVMVGSGMAKYGAYAKSGQSINALLDQFPKAVQTMLGIGSFDLSKATGFYGVLYLYLIVMATIHAVMLGSNIISKEERDRTSEFLFVKPISRASVISSKLSASILSLIILNLVTLLSSLVVVGYYNKNGSATHDILVLMAGMFVTQLIFLSIGTAFSAISRKPKSTTSASTGVLLLTFILYTAININSKLENLRYFTPYKYFDAKDIMAGGKLDPVFVILSAAIFASLLFATYGFYTKRDLAA
jgi:ABC-2 type transport system permease protein